MEHMPDQTEIVLQSIVADMQQLSARMDFFESVVLQLLMGLKEAGIIVDEEGEQEAEAEGTTEGTSRIILP